MILWLNIWSSLNQKGVGVHTTLRKSHKQALLLQLCDSHPGLAISAEIADASL